MINIDKITNHTPSGYATAAPFKILLHSVARFKAEKKKKEYLTVVLLLYRIPFNHVAFLGIAKLVQAACTHFLKEWIKAENKPLLVVLWCILAAGSLVLLLVERPWSRPGLNHWKVHEGTPGDYSRKNNG